MGSLLVCLALEQSIFTPARDLWMHVRQPSRRTNTSIESYLTRLLLTSNESWCPRICQEVRELSEVHSDHLDSTCRANFSTQSDSLYAFLVACRWSKYWWCPLTPLPGGWKLNILPAFLSEKLFRSYEGQSYVGLAWRSIITDNEIKFYYNKFTTFAKFEVSKSTLPPSLIVSEIALLRPKTSRF